jgi:hypothetical protein
MEHSRSLNCEEKDDDVEKEFGEKRSTAVMVLAAGWFVCREVDQRWRIVQEPPVTSS